MYQGTVYKRVWHSCFGSWETGESFVTTLIFVTSPDQDNYQTLFGVLDNCFLVAYAIGMFFRFVYLCCWQTLPCICLRTRPASIHNHCPVAVTVGYLESACLCGTT